MNQISVEELRIKLNSKKAFPIYKKKIKNKELKEVFTKDELRKKPKAKKNLLTLSIVFFLIKLMRGDFYGAIAALIFAFIFLFMKNPNEKFIEKNIKKNNEFLLKTYKSGLVKFFFLNGIGEIEYPKVKITD